MKLFFKGSFAASVMTLALAVGGNPLAASASTQAPADLGSVNVPIGAAAALTDGSRFGAVEDRLRFPDLSQSSAALIPPFSRPVPLPEIPTVQDQALIPLPSPAWSGMIGLTVLALVGSRRAIIRFVM